MNNYFCVLPFYGAEYDQSGYTTPCCLIPSGTDLQQVQTTMLNKQRATACQKCWILEDQGKISDRQLKNSSFDFYANRDIRFIEEDCQQGKFSPQIIKLYTSNLCNSTCATCGPEASTAWGTLTKNKKLIQINNSILDQLPIEDFIMLNFVGGEPLTEKKNFDLLERLITAEKTNCFISITTNGSTDLTSHQKKILSNFNNLNINLSIDGVGPVFEYIRYPLKWDKLLDNLDFYRSQNFKLSVSYTISNLNILYHNETIQWFTNQGLNYNHNLVTDPDYFSINSLPLRVKNQYTSDFFREHCSNDDEKFQRFLIEINKQDQLKGISINTYLPKLMSAIK
jgi:sulfatase maturation enzyme AslB (radical SAM superfamily)